MACLYIFCKDSLLLLFLGSMSKITCSPVRKLYLALFLSSALCSFSDRSLKYMWNIRVYVAADDLKKQNVVQSSTHPSPPPQGLTNVLMPLWGCGGQSSLPHHVVLQQQRLDLSTHDPNYCRFNFQFHAQKALFRYQYKYKSLD